MTTTPDTTDTNATNGAPNGAIHAPIEPPKDTPKEAAQEAPKGAPKTTVPKASIPKTAAPKAEASKTEAPKATAPQPLPPVATAPTGLRLRLKVWTDPTTRVRYLMPTAIMADPRSGLMNAYAMSDEDTKVIKLTPAEWNALPFFYFNEDGPAPRATARPVDVIR